jgi:hypothetical protein
VPYLAQKLGAVYQLSNHENSNSKKKLNSNSEKDLKTTTVMLGRRLDSAVSSLTLEFDFVYQTFYNVNC